MRVDPKTVVKAKFPAAVVEQLDLDTLTASST